MFYFALILLIIRNIYKIAGAKPYEVKPGTRFWTNVYHKETKRRKLSKLKLNLNKGLQLKIKKTTKLNQIPKENVDNSMKNNSGDENGEDICIYFSIKKIGYVLLFKKEFILINPNCSFFFT